jgi:hypothetical protein
MSSKEAVVVVMAPNPSDCFLALAAIDVHSVRRRMKLRELAGFILLNRNNEAD